MDRQNRRTNRTHISLEREPLTYPTTWSGLVCAGRLWFSVYMYLTSIWWLSDLGDT
jgi:hypothetical protein